MTLSQQDFLNNIRNTLNIYGAQNAANRSSYQNALNSMTSNLTPYTPPSIDFTGMKFGTPSLGDEAKGIALKALNVLDTPRALIVNPLGDLIKNGWSGSNLTQDFQNALTGDHTFVSDILKDNTQWGKDHPILSGVAGFLGDVALDPLTYLTFGAGSAAKAGLRAGLSEARTIGEGLGLGAEQITKGNFRNIVGNTAEQNVRNSYSHLAPEMVDQELVSLGARNKASAINEQIANAEKAARTISQNRLINFDIPFTNITKGFGMKPEILQIKAPVIGELGASEVTKRLGKLGLDDLQSSSIIKNLYNVEHASQMTIQQLDHFLTNMKNLTPESLQKSVLDGATNVVTDFKDALPQMNNSKSLAQFLEPHLDSLGYATKDGWNAKTLHNLLENDPSGRLNVLQDMAKSVLDRGTPMKEVAKEVLKEKSPDLVNRMMADLPKFVADSGGSSKLFRGLKEKNPFNARSLQTSDSFINNMANHIQDAYNKMSGGTRQMEADITEAKNAIAGLTKEEQNAIPYFLQNKFPKGMTGEMYASEHGLNLAKIEAASAPFQRIFAVLAENEKAVGALSKTRNNYFPHIRQLSKEDIDSILRRYGDDPELSQLLGRSSTNAFANARKGHQTLAEVDDYIGKLQDKLAQEADVEMKSALEEKLKQVSQLFQRDPIEALHARYRASIRTTAMTELQNMFKERGLIRNSNNGSKAFERLDAETASALGLKEGQYVHKDILRGLKKSDEIFTDKGMNTFFKTANTITALWKTGVTTYSFSHHANNVIGDIFNNMAAGVKLGDYKQAVRILKGKNLSDFDKQIYKKAMDEGVLGHSWMSEVSKNPFREAELTNGNFLDKSLDKLQRNKVTKMIHHPADFATNSTRLALFAHGMKMTGSQKKASELVRKYLFNYREITGADRAVRSVVPFWNWMKNNIPRQLETLAQQPRYAQMWNRLTQELNGKDSNIPDYAQGDVVKVGEDTYINPRLPVQDLNDLNPFSKILGGLNPLIKTPIELELNKQFFNGKPIDYEHDKNHGYSPQALARYGVNQLGVVGKVAGSVNDDRETLADSLQKLFWVKPQHFNR